MDPTVKINVVLYVLNFYMITLRLYGDDLLQSIVRLLGGSQTHYSYVPLILLIQKSGEIGRDENNDP